MSDESTASPSPLRLKPRLRPSEGAPRPGVVAPAVGVIVPFPSPGTEPSLPTLRFKPRAAAESPATGASVPALIGADVPVSAIVGEPPKFKFKPKGADSPASAALAADTGAQLIGALPPVPVAAPVVGEVASAAPAAASQTVGGVPRRTLPPFPVVAGPGSSRTNPSIPLPHVRIKAAAVQEPETFEERESRRRGMRRNVWLLVFAALGAGGYFGWPYLQPQFARLMTSKTAAGPTPSDTLNKIAHAPAAAINKAQDAIATRRASGQTRIDAAVTGDELPEKKPLFAPAVATKAKTPASAAAPTMAPLAPGLAASVQIEAAGDASPEFRIFVANAKVSGVFQGAPPRAMINGRLTRVGETAEPTLGIVFDGVDAEKKQLSFKDRSGAVISRRY